MSDGHDKDSAQSAPAPPAPQTGSHRPATNLVTRAVGLLVTGIALYVVFPSLSRVIGAWPQLSTLSPGWLAGAVAAEVAAFTCNFGLQRLVLRTRGWFAVVAAGLVGNAVTAVLPGGDAAGAGVQFTMLSRAGISADTAAGGLTAASLLGVGGLFALPIFALPAIAGGAAVQPGLVHAALLGLAGFVMFVVGGIVVLAADQPLVTVGRALQWLWNKSWGRHRKTVGFDHRLLSERNQVRSVLGRDWRRAVLLVGGRLGFDYLCLLCALRATGSDPNPSLVLLAYAAAQIIALVPITPGGLGIVEASLSGLLLLAGVSGGKAVVATLAYRLASYWLPLLAGGIAYPLYRRRYGPVQINGGAKGTTVEGGSNATPRPRTM
jgi:uncharacterized membrane protein YbhN (UPF0104 family)